MNTGVVLCVDDNGDDTLLFLQACRKRKVSFQAAVLEDGQEAIDYLNVNASKDGATQSPLPDFILLDLKMPKKSGFEVLEWLRGQAALQPIPVSILSASQSDDDVRRAYALGATWFLMKPVQFQELLDLTYTLDQWMRTRDNLAFTKLPYYRAPLRT